MLSPSRNARRCVIAVALAQILVVPLHADEKATAKTRYEAAKADYQLVKGWHEEGRVGPPRFFRSLQNFMVARLDLCSTKEEQIAVIHENLAIAAREIATEENELGNRRPYVPEPGVGYAAGFLVECGRRLEQLTNAP